MLQENVGDIETEWFIHDVQNQKQDYTVWQREHYDAMSADEIREGIKRNTEESPFVYEKAVEI